MRNVKLPGAVENVGAGQGFVGISVLYDVERTTIGEEVREVPVWRVAYELTREEVQAMIEGGRVVLTVVGRPPILPHRLDVQPS